MGAFECVRKVYQTDGLRGFYRGMSASYAGISETVIHFVIYESIKQKLLEYKIASTMENDEESVKEASDFVGMMLAAATSKTCATSIAYPHEVVRTRLREEGTKYRSFFQTLSLVVQEEGYGSLYRGLTTHLVRQIPNTAIMMATYELVVYLLNGQQYQAAEYKEGRPKDYSGPWSIGTSMMDRRKMVWERVTMSQWKSGCWNSNNHNHIT